MIVTRGVRTKAPGSGVAENGLAHLQALARRWRINRPLVAFDLETTGISPRADRIVSIAALMVRPDHSTAACISLVNPGTPIPDEAIAVHGITNAMVTGSPRFDDLVPNLTEFFADTDLIGYNIARFDADLMKAEFERAGIALPRGCRIIDPCVIFHRNEPRTLEAAVRFYLGDRAFEPHQALADAVAAVGVLRAQAGRYQLPGLDELAELCDRRDPSWIDSEGKLRWRDGEMVLGFGKYSGVPVRDLTERDRE